MHNDKGKKMLDVLKYRTGSHDRYNVELSVAIPPLEAEIDAVRITT